jgi:hypothetical protein
MDKVLNTNEPSEHFGFYLLIFSDVVTDPESHIAILRDGREGGIWKWEILRKYYEE